MPNIAPTGAMKPEMAIKAKASRVSSLKLGIFDFVSSFFQIIPYLKKNEKSFF